MSKKQLPKYTSKDEARIKETIMALSISPTQTAAAKKLGISRRALTNRLNKYQLREYVAKLTSEALSTLQLGSVKAAENFVNKIDHRDARVSMEASKEILDRVGVVKPDRGTIGASISDGDKEIKFVITRG